MKLTSPKGKLINITEFNIRSVYAGLYEGSPDERFKKQTIEYDIKSALKDDPEEKVTVIERECEHLPKASCTVFFNDLEDGGCIIFYSELRSNPIDEFLSILDNQKWSNITRPWTI
jgi:hypothetical protein